MRIKPIIILTLIIVQLSSFAHENTYRLSEKNRFYIIVEQENKPTIFATYLIMDMRNAISERFIKKEEIKLYPDIIKTRTLLVKLKKETKLISMKEVYKNYSISIEEQKLPIVVDDNYVDFTENIIADTSHIVYVKSQIHPVTKQKVLHIRTKDVIRHSYPTDQK